MHFVTCFQHTATQCGYLSFFIVPYRAISCRVAAASKSGGKKGLACLTDCASTPKHELMMSLMCQMLGPCLDSASNYVCSIIYSITPFVIPESFWFLWFLCNSSKQLLSSYLPWQCSTLEPWDSSRIWKWYPTMLKAWWKHGSQVWRLINNGCLPRSRWELWLRWLRQLLCSGAGHWHAVKINRGNLAIFSFQRASRKTRNHRHQDIQRKGDDKRKKGQDKNSLNAR